jgi:hypothetical protein
MEQTSTAKVPTCIGLPPDLRDRMDAAAAAMERPRSWIATKAIERFLAEILAPIPRREVMPPDADGVPACACAAVAPAARDTSAVAPSIGAASRAASFSPVKDTKMDNPQSAPKPPPTPASALCDALDLHADALARAQATHREKADAAERARADTAQRIAASLGCTDQGGR